MVEINIRPALVQDAADLARLDNVASHGFGDFYWQKRAVEEGSAKPNALAEQAMADPEYRSGWRQAIVAEVDGEVVGGANGYFVDDDPELHQPSPEPVFEPIRQLFELTVGDWLLDWLAVYQSWQGKGIGARLLDEGLNRAKAVGVNASLVVEDSNETALALYRSRGFRQRDQRSYIPFNKNSKTQNWLLMSAPVM